MRAALLLALLCACGGPASSGADLGEVSIGLVQVPQDVACVRAVFTGARRTETIRLAAWPGSAATWALSGMPTGEVVITGDAFPVACADLTGSVARSWFAAPLVKQIEPGAVVDVQLRMYR